MGGVGSGKSITALKYYEKVTKKKINLYIITTPRKRDSLEWDKELSNIKLSTNNELNDITVVVDSWNNIKKYIDVKDSFFIFDEQRVVGYGAWARTFIKISKSNNWILLSATPGDVWVDYTAVFIANGFYKNKTQFEMEHVVRLGKFQKISRYMNSRKLEKHRDDILVELEYEKHTTSHEIQVMCEYDKVKYNRVFRDRWDIWEDKPIVNIAQALYLIRKVVNSDHSRLEELHKIVEEHPRVIIFYNYNYELYLLREFCEQHNYNFAEWNGWKHEPIPELSRWVYLAQYTSSAEGWECITTNTVVLYSQNYSYKIIEQAKGRVDRRVTPYTDLYYYTLISTAPIDRAIRRAYREKRIFNQQAFFK